MNVQLAFQFIYTLTAAHLIPTFIPSFRPSSLAKTRFAIPEKMSLAFARFAMPISARIPHRRDSFMSLGKINTAFHFPHARRNNSVVLRYTRLSSTTEGFNHNGKARLHKFVTTREGKYTRRPIRIYMVHASTRSERTISAVAVRERGGRGWYIREYRTTWKMSSSWRKRSPGVCSKRGMWVAESGCDPPACERASERARRRKKKRRPKRARGFASNDVARRDPRGHSRHANNDRLLPNTRARAEPVIFDAARTTPPYTVDTMYRAGNAV